MLSYTFLRSTQKEDIVVPMVSKLFFIVLFSPDSVGICNCYVANAIYKFHSALIGLVKESQIMQ